MLYGETPINFKLRNLIETVNDCEKEENEIRIDKNK